MTQQNNNKSVGSLFKVSLKKLSEQPSISDPAFADAVYTAISHGSISETAFRDAFGLSLGTVERWTLLKNLPHPSTRSSILCWLHDSLP